MSRPTDWHEVFGIKDPTPGETYTIRQVAHKWGGIADAAEYAENKLTGWLRDDAVSTWIGKAGEAFAAHTSDLPGQLDKAKNSYRLASEAMTWWAGRLESHQYDADRALVQGRAAKQDLASAHQALSAAHGQVSTASGAGALTYTGPAAHAPKPEDVTRATNALHSAQAAEGHAQGLVTDAQGRLDAARRLAQQAGSLRENDGRTTSDRIHHAADAGIKPRSWWEKFKDGVAEAWSVIVAIAKIVVMVLGVVALIIGGPLAWIVFAAALIVLADTLMKYFKGEATLLDVALAALSCIPCTKGLTTLAELSAAFKAGGMLGAGAHLLGAGKAAIVGMAEGLRSMAGTMRTVLATFKDAASVRMQNVVALARGFHSMVDSELGIVGSLKSLPELLRVPMPRAGTEVFRIYGAQIDEFGNVMNKPGFPDWNFGSGPHGESWTPTNPLHVSDFRADAGLPDENPMRFLHTGTIAHLPAVHEIRLGLPLDGQPGGLPEYIIKDAAHSVHTTGVSGYNGPGTQAPGSFTPKNP